MTDIPAGKYQVGEAYETIWNGSSRRYRIFGSSTGNIFVEVDGSEVSEGLTSQESIDVEGSVIRVKKYSGDPGQIIGEYYNLD